MGYNWKEVQRLIGWDDESVDKLKEEYEKIKKEWEEEDERQGICGVPRQPRR